MMENSYGIGVTNRYALFLDDDADPLEVLKVQEQEKELKKKSKIAEKENKGKAEITTKGKVTVSQRKPIKETQNQKTHDVKREEIKPGQRPNAENRPERNRFSSFSENREERNNKKNRDERTFNGSTEGNREREERPRREFNDNPDSRTRGRGVTRPRGGRGRIYDQRGKREFDRQSGSDKTGVKPVDKREGGGAHNWGSHKDDIEEIDKNNEIDASWDMGDKVETTPTATEVKGEVSTVAADGETPVVTEEEPKQITLDEWRAQRANRQKPQYNLRKAGEGEDPSQWKKMYALNKKKEGSEEDSEDEEYDVSEYPQRVGRQKHVLDINIHFSDRRVGGGGRGRGRSGPRGGGGGSRGAGGGGPPRGDREPRGERASGNGNAERGAGGPDRGGLERGGGAGAAGGPERERPASGARPYRGGGGGGGDADQVEEPAQRIDHQHKTSNRQNAPKVDDEHDFPSLS